MKITRLYEYDNGKDVGWAVETADGGTLLVTIDKGGRLDVIKRRSWPTHPDIVGSELKRWNYYRRVFDNELVLWLETSKGEVRLYVGRIPSGVGSSMLTAKVSLEYQV